MKRTAAARLCALALAMAFSAGPATVTPAAETSTRTVPTDGDAKAIRALVRGLHEEIGRFFSSGKLEPVMEYYRALRTYYPPYGEPQNAAAVRERLLSHAPRVQSFRTQVGPIQVHISGDLAIATCEVDEQYLFDGNTGNEHLLSTYVLERRSGDWQIVHVHQSMKFSESGPAPPGK
ncbi:MAG: nuclear transport factor 2 family protein [Acidobacteria bacterium]|nr:nuclear transport factor 2 family protein [Acidobacteriota bacterium]